MNFYINFKNKSRGDHHKWRKIKIPNVKKLSWFEKGIGLMFSSRKKAKALLFEFEKPTKMSYTSLFVFFPFIIIWLDSKNEVIDFKKINPFTFNIPSLKYYRKVLEVPFNNNYEGIIKKLLNSRRQNIYK
ncbi:MAG: DUF192 domain-containing protein [Nanoarchaeota archaeon]|nr:DUF192 domain-containing protein [Nanoarchaeota archaeon]